jgi:hypothetical protein
MHNDLNINTTQTVNKAVFYIRSLLLDSVEAGLYLTLKNQTSLSSLNEVIF